MKKMWKIKIPLMLILLWSFSSAALYAADAKNVVQDETGTYYVVQKGDTLWDISNFFLQSPWYWPEIWSVNSQIPILNPHLIFPGQRLRLYGWGEGPEIMPPSAEPPHIAALRYFHYPLISHVGYIQKEPEKSFGTIFKVQGNKEMISTDDIVYFQESGVIPIAAGDRFTVYRTSAPIYDRQEKTLIGNQYLITGTVEVLQRTDSYVMGRITQAFRAIRIGDQLKAFEERSADIPLTDSVPGLSAKIITSEERTTIMGEYDIAFIDKGSLDGVRVGQEYEVFEVDHVRPPGASGEKTVNDIIVPIEVGEVIVLLARPTASTCLITNSLKSIQAGVTVDFPVK